MAYTKEQLEGFTNDGTPEGRKKLVEILKTECGVKMSEIVQMKGPERVSTILEFFKKQGGGKAAAAAKPAAKPAAGGAKPKGAAKAKEPDPEPEEEETEEAAESVGGVSEEALQAFSEEVNGKLDTLLEGVNSLLAETMKAQQLARIAAQAAGFDDETIDELLGGN